jgi:ubiquinone/menaquinone biosynthesis C-methylase UbiE
MPSLKNIIRRLFSARAAQPGSDPALAEDDLSPQSTASGGYGKNSLSGASISADASAAAKPIGGRAVKPNPAIPAKQFSEVVAEVIEAANATAAAEGGDAANLPQLDEMELMDSVEQVWTPTRIELVQKIWGPGFCRPGGTDFTIQQVKNFSPLTEGMNFMDANAGLGGALMAVAESFPLAIQGMEANEAIFRQGRALLAKAGTQVIPMRFANPEELEMPKEALDCIYARDLLVGVGGKARLLQQFCQGLRERGQMLLVDLMMPDEVDPKPVRRWLAQQSISSVPWTASHFEKSIRSNPDMECRAQDDITDAYIEQIVNGWRAYLQTLLVARPSKKFLQIVLKEVVYWAELVELMQSGKLRYMRLYARRKPQAETKA